jgi:ParB family transcriptional regulator, chromosome partitioning protein
MGKADEIRKKFGANIGESVSSSSGPARGAGGMPARREPTGEQKGASRSVDVLVIEVDRIIPDPEQPRKEFDDEAIGRMAASLLKHGQISPIAVRWSPDADRYVIVAGERRWRGAMRAGIGALDAKVRKGPSDSGDLLAVQLVENLLREDLSPMDQASAYRRLMDANGWSGARLAAELNIAQPRVVQALALLDLPGAVKERVQLEELPASTAYEISRIADPAVQEEVAARVVEQGLTRQEARHEVARVTSRGGAKNPGKGRGGRAGGSKPLKPWSHKGPGGVKVIVDYGRKADREAGRSALEEALARYRKDHEAASA